MLTVANQTSRWYWGEGEGFITGLLSELDTAGEWHIENSNLYLWAPNNGNPDTLKIEAKARKWCFDLSNRTNIRIFNINLFAGSMRLNNSNACEINSCTMTYLSHFIKYTWDGMDATGDIANGNNGIWINGNENIIKDCHLQQSAGSGIIIMGARNTIANNSISDINYSATYSCPLCIKNSTGGNKVYYNTIWNSGRDLIQLYGASSDLIAFNELSYAGWLCRDLGMIYQWGRDGNGTRIAYNWIHDNKAAYQSDHCGPGIYNDNYCANFIDDHNVIWNCEAAVRLNEPCNNLQVYNNTAFNCDDFGTHSYNQWPSYMPSYWTYGNATSSILKNNLYLGANPDTQVQNANGKDFTLKTGAAAINSGSLIAGFTEGFIGAGPDLGAYESGATAWRPGQNGVGYEERFASSDTGDYNDTDNRIIYSGTWQYSTHRGLGDFSDDVHYTTTNGDYCELTFTGNSIEVYSEKSNDGGDVAIYIDNTYRTTVNCYNSQRLTYRTIFGAALGNGTHALRLVKISGQFMLLDKFRVLNLPTVPPSTNPILDRNGDGISDVWAALYPNIGGPNDSPLGDGMTNLQKSLAGLDPTNPASRFAATSSVDASGNLIASWASVAGKHYHIETSADLENWTPLPDAVSPKEYVGTDGALSAIVQPAGATAPNRAFWHVVVFDVDSDGSGLNDWEKLHINNAVAVTGVTLAPGSGTLTRLGEVIALAPTVLPGNASNKAVSFRSSAPAVATVDDTGRVTAIAYGSATITVTTSDGSFTATSAITVDSGGGQVSAKVGYAISSKWDSGFSANITLTNIGTAPIQGWTLQFTLPVGNTIVNLWDGRVTSSGQAVTVGNASYNGTIPPGATISLGFSANGPACTPADFIVTSGS